MRHDVRRLHIDVPMTPLGYDVVCGRGVLADLPRRLGDVGVSGRVLVCSDSMVASLHGERLLSLLREAGYETALWTMPAGEVYKTLQTVGDAYTWLADQRAERSDTLIAFGGGVVGDLAGFAAATYVRGLRVVQAPTTLVAQVDSALGGKVGVDLPAGKNLVGAFHHPALVVADADLLATLPVHEWHAGLAEVIKHGIIRDTALLDRLERDRETILGRDPDVVAWVVAQAAAVKATVVGEDPLERGVRRILNYGHTLGHAVEREAGYGVVLHGEAVAWGMAAAARIGAALGTCDEGFVAWQDRLLRAYGLLQPLPPLPPASLLAATRLDKKVVGGRVNWVLPLRRGAVTVTADVAPEAVRAAVEWLAEGGRDGGAPA